MTMVAHIRTLMATTAILSDGHGPRRPRPPAAGAVHPRLGHGRDSRPGRRRSFRRHPRPQRRAASTTPFTIFPTSPLSAFPTWRCAGRSAPPTPKKPTATTAPEFSPLSPTPPSWFCFPLWLGYEAIERFRSPVTVVESWMIWTSLAALAVNGGITLALVRGRSDLNLRSILVHNFGDALSNIAIIIGAIIIHFTGTALDRSTPRHRHRYSGVVVQHRNSAPVRAHFAGRPPARNERRRCSARSPNGKWSAGSSRRAHLVARRSSQRAQSARPHARHAPRRMRTHPHRDSADRFSKNSASATPPCNSNAPASPPNPATSCPSRSRMRRRRKPSTVSQYKLRKIKTRFRRSAFVFSRD